MQESVIRPDDINSYRKRNCFDDLCKFIDSNSGKSGKIAAICGLRRTGKTILMEQLALKYGCNEVYQVDIHDTMDDVFDLLDEKHDNDEKLVLIDEITNAEDFIENSAILADIYAKSGIDIIISADSPDIILKAESKALLGRIVKFDTTYISFAEYSFLFGISNINDYVEFSRKVIQHIKLNRENFIVTDRKIKRVSSTDYCPVKAESIIFYNTQNALAGKDFYVCQPTFSGDLAGEYDMLVYVKASGTHYAFEIKHNATFDAQGNYVDGQDKHLMNEDLRSISEESFGYREQACVLYNGKSFLAPNQTIYLNIADFLKTIDKTRDINRTMDALTSSLPVKSKESLTAISKTGDTPAPAPRSKPAISISKGCDRS